MPNWTSVAAFTRDFDKMMSDLTGPEKRKITRAQAEEAQRIADRAAANDLGGDGAFSGFVRNNPIKLATQIRNAKDFNTMLTPTKLSAGPWTVAEFGRNQGDAGGFAGPGINRSTGLTARTKSGAVRKVRARRARRWNGTTQPKHTASDALRVMEQKLPKIADDAVAKVIRKKIRRDLMANKITVLLDLVTDKATSAAKGFKASIAEAEGSANKFKAGASSAFATVQANAGAFALGAGSALAAFGAKSVEAFTQGALAAGKFSEASGLAVEDASRLNEVAGDLGLSADAVAGTVTKLQKAVASNSAAVKQLGIETKTTADGQTDVLATYLDAIDKLGGVKDANERALLASQLFGKGFADSAEIVLGSADELKAKLDDVSGAQVFDAKEVAQAKEFRDSMENLRDTFEQISITVGQDLVPTLTDVAGVLTDITNISKDIGDIPGLGVLTGVVEDQLNPVGFLARTWGQAKDAITGGGDAAETAAAQVDRAGDAVSTFVPDLRATADAAGDAADELVDLGDKAANSGPKIGDMAGALEEVNDRLKEAADEGAQRFQDALQGVLDKVDEVSQGVRDRINMEGALDDITAQFRAVQEAGEEAAKGGKEGTAQYREEVRRLRLQILDLVDDLDTLSANDKIRLDTVVERGSLDELFGVVAELSNGITVPVVFSTPQQAFSGVQATIASNAIPNMTFTNPNPAPVDNSRTTIIYPVGSSPTTTAIDQRLYATRNGPR